MRRSRRRGEDWEKNGKKEESRRRLIGKRIRRRE